MSKRNAGLEALFQFNLQNNLVRPIKAKFQTLLNLTLKFQSLFVE